MATPRPIPYARQYRPRRLAVPARSAAGRDGTIAARRQGFRGAHAESDQWTDPTRNAWLRSRPRAVTGAFSFVAYVVNALAVEGTHTVSEISRTRYPRMGRLAAVLWLGSHLLVVVASLFPERCGWTYTSHPSF